MAIVDNTKPFDPYVVIPSYALATLVIEGFIHQKDGTNERIPVDRFSRPPFGVARADLNAASKVDWI